MRPPTNVHSIAEMSLTHGQQKPQMQLLARTGDFSAADRKQRKMVAASGTAFEAANKLKKNEEDTSRKKTMFMVLHD